MSTTHRAEPLEGPPTPSIDRIRAAAMRIFAQRGYHATSVREITRAAGIVPAALYNHFASKADLLQDLILQGHNVLNMRVEIALGSAGPGPGERLDCIIREVAQFHAEFTELAKLSNREFRALPEPQCQPIVAHRRQFRELLEGILSDGIAEGVFRVPIVNGTSAVTLIAMSILDSLVHIADWYRPDRIFSPEQIGELYTEWIAASVRAPDSLRMLAAVELTGAATMEGVPDPRAVGLE
jgi:AcrR family transcriptional regulator